uniref:fibroblast growth factor 18-like isoform X3 n=1 Tax=Oncorhynchus gorbuscha TaxID=8017 RepID=UPI001EAE8E27|nr:fibroblast growth factor 18-like isoform X3 [Oncorhynchus gorbuscha]
MSVVPSRFIYLCLHFLVLYFQLQESQQSSADFRIYIENHTRNPDDLSRKQIRIYQLYSHTTGKHVQILGKKVNANGDDGGKYALLVVETETFGSHIRIKGKETQWKESGVRLRGRILGEQLHSSRVGQVQRVVPRLQQEGEAQKRIADHTNTTGSAFHETPPEGQGGPTGRVPFHYSN